MQETVTVTDVDNLGAFRASTTPSTGIVASLVESHISIVRTRNLPRPYLTRIGRKGARGIDHILIPKATNAQAFITAAMVDKDNLGSFHFPSDHKLIQCAFRRCGANNAERGEDTTKYAYGTISKIKLQQDGAKGDDLVLDTSQFKGSQRYREQSMLYAKLQDLTADTSTSTSHYLDGIDMSIKKIYNSLWKDGIAQNTNGPTNKLVRISSRQAAELTQVLTIFELGVKDTMTFLDLVSISDQLSKGASVRNMVKLKHGDFKLFSNLPIATKLRYLRSGIQSKRRRLKKYINAIQEFQLHQSNNHDTTHLGLYISDLVPAWKSTIDTSALLGRAETIYEKYITEVDVRDAHVQAIQCSQHTSHSKGHWRGVDTKVIWKKQLEFVSEATIKLINHWLHESQCDYGFNCACSSNRLHNLRRDIDNWKLKVSDLPDLLLNPISEVDCLNKTLSHLQNARADLFNLESRVGLAQTCYRSETIKYLLNVNNIELFTRKILPKGRDTPTTHTEIWDSILQDHRPCRSDIEELIATGEFHGQWMANSLARENCAFAAIQRDGLLGMRGVRLMPDRVITDKDIPNLISNGEKLPKKIKSAFLKAHGKHIAKLFTPPKTDHESLFYPFYLLSRDGFIHHEDQLETWYWKSLASVPGKARYEGFHMAVIGRFGPRWRRTFLQIIKLILVMRYIPNNLKSMARFPIPKPGRVNEYRPISLCNDIYCFVNAISTHYSSKGIIAANILHSGIGAYVKGRGCSNLVSVEQAIREDCIESGMPSSQTDEDEEKFFDRIPVEIVLAAMRVNGFPEQGFLELKASGMEPKAVEIVTGKGVAHALFACGIEQGNPDSPTIANLVIKFKHDLWLNILSDLGYSNLIQDTTPQRDAPCSDDAYVMHISDPLDGRVAVDRIGYCDDNTRYTSSANELDVIKATELFIKQSGDLSLVTKIGRKGSKSEVHYFNLSAQKAISLRKIESIAWSFKSDSPVTELVPFKIKLQQLELRKAYNLINFHELDDDAKQAFLDIFRPKAHKHLGLCSTLDGDTSSASLGVINKIKERMATINLFKLQRDAQVKGANMLCSSVHSYAPLQMGHMVEDLHECDALLIRYVSKRHGLTTTDCKHPLFIDAAKGGFGFKSFIDVDIVANAREVEIGLNGILLDSETLRARLHAFKYRHGRANYIIYRNFIGTAITKLAMYGLHIRDINDGVINYILGILNMQHRFKSIGDTSYNGSTDFSIGKGKVGNLDIGFGSPLHIFLRKSITPLGEMPPNIPESDFQGLPISSTSLKLLLRKAQKQMFHDRSSMYNCWEWNATGCVGREHVEFFARKRWKFINVANLLKINNDKYWLLSEDDIHKEAITILNDNIPLSILQRIHKSRSPVFVATDGSHTATVPNTNTMSSHLTTGAAVVCLAKILDGEAFNQGLWANRQATPILARFSKLPRKIGCSTSDIGHGEGIGGCLGLEIVDIKLPKILILDSTSVRNTMLSLRDRDTAINPDRNYIRKIISGISKCICSRMQRCFFEIANSHRWDNAGLNNDTVFQEFLSMGQKWATSAHTCTQDMDMRDAWTDQYWDDHHTLPILKVDSHQLDDEGCNIKKPKRYSKLIPNLFLLSCNFFADKAAELAQSKTFIKPRASCTDAIKIPNSSLRFFVTWNGMGIDKHVSTWLNFVFQEERIKELKKRATQGLPWRVVDHQWRHIMMKRELFNSLRGFSRTHTRSLYKSQLYREGWIKETLTKSSDILYTQQRNYSTKEWTDYLSGCRWCENKCGRKGNRTHALHFCQHKLLRNFRFNITNLLEQKILDFLRCIKETQNENALNLFIQSIEDTLLRLHGIEKSTECLHYDIYRTKKMWVEGCKLALPDQYQYRQIPMYSHIFGFIPITETDKLSDTNLNTATCISLGIIPKELDREIIILSNNLYLMEIDPQRIRTIRESYRTLWKEIKEINEAKVMGLHKIIGIISKNYESEFRAKHNIEDHSWRAMKKSLKEASGAKSSTKRKRQATNEERKKFCTGVTCNRLNKTWNFELRPNLITFNIKHCQRCAKQQTAFKKGAQIIDDCIIHSTQACNDTLIQHLDETSNNIIYKDIMKHIHQKTPCHEVPQPKKSTKRGLTDAQKGTLKTISTCITKLTNSSDQPLKRLKLAKQILQDTSRKSNQFSKDDLQHNININAVLFDSKSFDQKPTIKQEIQNTDPIQNQINETEENRIRGDIASALVNNQWMFSYSLDRAIRNIRMNAPTNVFIANTGISTALQTWQPSHGWEILAIHFRSMAVSTRKPHGTYLIPIFTGKVTGGHWNLAVIWKQSKICKGWMLDSMGQGDIHSDIAKTIKQAFGKAKRKCRWQHMVCRHQREVECGPRTIGSMVSICENLKTDKPIDIAIAKASLMHISEMHYAPELIRQTAASWMRMTEDTRVRWEMREMELRLYFRNRNNIKNRKETNNVAIETIMID